MRDMGASSFSSELVRSSTDLVLLALLRERPMYGYEILTTLADRGNGEFQLKQGTLYPLLYRLEREGWIRARWETPPKGKRHKTYVLTAEGRKVLGARSAEWLRFTAAVRSILEECGHA
jgi:PadR family transcriptional regulator PadR